MQLVVSELTLVNRFPTTSGVRPGFRAAARRDAKRNDGLNWWWCGL